ncbi:MAG: helix-turn-helix domain-containing protein [Lachnospiraceae bacterium]
MKRAEELLLSTSYSIDYIMELIGYHNKGYFYKIFLEKYKMTPAQYRAKNKGGA